MERARVEAFSDGVFAVAITLLVLDLRVPLTHGSLIAALADQWPVFAAFAISFVVIGIIWVNHHALFHHLARVDRPLLFINLGLLMSVVLIPFVTALFALYLSQPGDQAKVAGALFNGALLLMSLMFQASSQWTRHRPELLRTAPREQVSLLTRIRFSAGVWVYLACIGLSFVNPVVALLLDGAVALYYVADQLGTATTE